MTKSIVLSLFATFIVIGNSLHAQSYFGSIYENGIESKMNWYFQSDQMCIEYIHLNPENENIELHTRLYLNSRTNEVSIVDLLRPDLEKFTTSADSIFSTRKLTELKLIPHRRTKDLEGFGTCQVYNGKNHLGDYLLLVDSSEVNLWKFNAFFKDDAVIKSWNLQKKQGIPIQIVHTNPMGEVLKSVQFHSNSPTVDRAIFN